MNLVETLGGIIKEFGQENMSLSPPYLKEAIAFYYKHPRTTTAGYAQSLTENNAI